MKALGLVIASIALGGAFGLGLARAIAAGDSLAAICLALFGIWVVTFAAQWIHDLHD